MPKNGNDSIVKFIKTEVCPLSGKECYDAIDKFREHGNTLKLVDEVFDHLISCDSDKCKTNEAEIKKAFELFIKENEVSKQ